MKDGLPARPEDVFSSRASFYTTSKVHDDVETLTWLVEAAAPSATDMALDVATGTGHTALALAPRVTQGGGDRPYRGDAGGGAQARRPARDRELSPSASLTRCPCRLRTRPSTS